MNENSIDVFGKAMLYIYQASLENLGLKGELRVVRTAESNAGWAAGAQHEAVLPKLKTSLTPKP